MQPAPNSAKNPHVINMVVAISGARAMKTLTATMFTTYTIDCRHNLLALHLTFSIASLAAFRNLTPFGMI